MPTLSRLTVSIAKDFSPTPGPRYRKDGKHSGEEFREEVLTPKYRQAVASNSKLLVDLDGGYGYATSFLEESFGGLAREFGIAEVQAFLEVKSDEEPYLIADVQKYIREAKG